MAGQSTFASSPGGTALAIFLKKFAGEVLTTFSETNVMSPLITTRTIPNGKSAQFPASGRAQAFFHKIGENILDAANTVNAGANGYLSNILAAERVINIDSKLLSVAFIDMLDEAMAHYDVRSIYTTEVGRALAKRFDQLALITAVLAAKTATATISGLLSGQGGTLGGETVSDAGMATQGVALSNALFKAAQKMDEKDVPKQDRVAVITPAMYYNLIRDPNVTLITGANVSGVYNIAPVVGTGSITTAAGQSSASSGYPMLQQGIADWSSGSIVRQLAGFTLLASNHIPSTNIQAGGAGGSDPFFSQNGSGNTYIGDFSKTKGICFQKGALGCVKLKDLVTESEYKLEYQGTPVLAKFALGMGVLRPECAIELAVP